MTTLEVKKDDYIQIEVIDGPRFRGHDIYIVRWADFPSTIGEYMDYNEEATVKMTHLQMTEEEFEAICEGNE